MGLARELRSRRTVDRREISVEAWADKDGIPFKMWCRPLTCYDLDQLQKKHPKFLETMSIAGMVDLILMKAEDQNGERLFSSAEDRLDLMGEETAVISGIAEQMFADVQSMEVAEKNS